MSLGVFADPRSVAVIGASADPAKWGHWLARGALRGAHRRTVHLVSRSGAVVDGVASRPSLSDLPDTPELAVLCVPPSSIEQVMGEGLELGVRGFLAITAGTEDARLAARVQAAGARLVGPNCLGIYDAATALELAWGNFTPGSLGIVSQSGQLGLELAGLAGEAGIGVSRFVSVGNQADVSAAEILADLASHDLTRVVVVYLESFGGSSTAGRALLGTLQTLRERGKPVVVLTVGASEASRAAARSHTGALTASSDVVEAACRAAGAILAETPAQAVDLAQMLLDGARPVGRRVAVVGDSGGQGALAADTLARAGLEVPRLSDATVAALGRTLPEGAGARNPVDLAGAGERDLTSYATLVSTLLASGEVDAVLLTGYFGSYGQDAPSLAAAEHRVIGMLGDAGRAAGLPVVVHTMGLDNPAVTALREQGMPTYHTIDAAGRSLGLATELALRAPRLMGTPPQVTEGAPSGYLAARALLGEYGVAYPAAVAVRDRDDVLAAPLRPPYVLKAAWLEHKTEAAGVVVGLAGAAEAAEALGAMTARLGAGEYVLEEMDNRPHVAELIVGARRDPSFGPVVMVGAGGVNAEVYRDVAVELAPVTEEVAMDMLRRLRILPLLTGWRGRPAVSLEGAAAVVAAVSRLVAQRPGIEECEINPLRVGPGGALAVDALVVSR
ncbi:acetate--CoA ligase family protein [Planotetraspora sp. A-T 1434]|uniref:acetate--CoA ligase family protein n=1 Tax=Planotetraspora sp. A-T 1434 TaxID=2979219 RepID=UPI0021BEE14E|nr:acetate--CoA ligase family protein [Planotetraspora sp. A-T 1434]MCT9930207.1 acetate--CoA ligase family protein [Planotetraspora sp. A-T 1434]